MMLSKVKEKTQSSFEGDQGKRNLIDKRKDGIIGDSLILLKQNLEN